MSQFPIVGNGPAGTFVLFPHLALRVSLPTDQVIYSDEDGHGTRVGFGGMAFRGEEGGQLVFDRVRELHPEDQLSPARSHVMRLDVAWVHELQSRGKVVWRNGG